MSPIVPEVNARDLEEAIKNCELEAIHQVGYIQPMGILLALDDTGLLISHVSENIGNWFPYSPAELIGKPFSLLVGEQQAERIRLLIGLEEWRHSAITSFSVERNGVTLNLDVQISRSGGLWIIEIEHEMKGEDDLFQKLFIPIRDALWQLDAEADISRYTNKVVEQVRLLTGYDRVMMYQFDDNWDGEVIAESRADDVESYLGNRFPAGDIPPQARQLYTKNLVRLIADVNTAPVRVIPTFHRQSNQPLDMTYSSLRALSPVHIEYLRNMGVRASLSISLIQNDRLWGLIACHHTSPKYIPMRVRELDEFIGKTVSLKLSNIENNNKIKFYEKIRLLLEKLTHQIRQCRDVHSVIETFNKELLSLVHADGAIINLSGNRYHIGETPRDEHESELDEWLKELSPRNLFQTDSLPSVNPALKVYRDVACGMMVAPLDNQLDSYIAWFRSSVTKTVRWAGNPDKIVRKDHGKLTISPRDSFATWVETFHDKSVPWSSMEIETAHSLSLSIIEVLNLHALEQSEENYRFLTDNSSDMIARFTLEGLYTFVSPACENLFGYDSKSMVGKPVLEFVYAEDRSHFRDTLDLIGKQRDTDIVLFRTRHGSGKTVWLEYTLKSTRNSKTGKVEIVANGRDVTQRHAYQMASEDLHRRNALMLEISGDGIINFDLEGKISYANEKVRQILGWETGELNGLGCCELFHLKSRGEFGKNPGECSLLKSIRLHESSSSPGCYFKHKDGNEIHVEYTCTPMKDDARYNGAVLVFNKLSDHLQAGNIDIKETSEAVMITDGERHIVSVNRAFIAITGYSAEEAIGQTPRLLKSGVHTSNFYEAMFAALHEKRYWAGEIWNRRKNGEIYPQWGSISAILDEHGEVHNYVAVFSDVSKAKQAEDRLYYLANHDALTGLANRTKFVDHLNYALDRARRNDTHKVAVAFIDLDRFKIINDRLGHAIGDQYLVAIAKRIASVCRDQDLLSRWGGDEFVLAMDNISGQQAVTDVVLRIINVVKAQLSIEGHELEPTLSIGISVFPEDADNTTDLVKAADTAMYRVKEGGRNGFEFFAAHHADENKKKFEIVSELNRALRLNEFVLHYQPQVKSISGEIIGLEALVRWQHPERGFLSPASFIPLAEELGLINQLGEWVLLAACRQMAEWQEQGVVFPRVSVNISPSQLNQGLVYFVQKVLTQNSLSANLLELELTEGALALGGHVIPLMKQLRELGVSLAIDDFGTGYSSLGHLKNFPITCFKIDKSFVDGLPDNLQDAAIVKTILSLGTNLNVEVVVEGVESMAQRDFLNSIGATIIQGYFYDKPLPAEAIAKRLQLGGY
jgi:diguanylate cyclase (GGDEF)-like protein/PAS domain S-box-containing protein